MNGLTGESLEDHVDEELLAEGVDVGVVVEDFGFELLPEEGVGEVGAVVGLGGEEEEVLEELLCVALEDAELGGVEVADELLEDGGEGQDARGVEEGGEDEELLPGEGEGAVQGGVAQRDEGLVQHGQHHGGAVALEVRLLDLLHVSPIWQA